MPGPLQNVLMLLVLVVVLILVLLPVLALVLLQNVLVLAVPLVLSVVQISIPLLVLLVLAALVLPLFAHTVFLSRLSQPFSSDSRRDPTDTAPSRTAKYLELTSILECIILL